MSRRLLFSKSNSGNNNMKDYKKNYVNQQSTGSYIGVVQIELDVDPQRDDDASPMSTYGCMLRPT